MVSTKETLRLRMLSFMTPIPPVPAGERLHHAVDTPLHTFFSTFDHAHRQQHARKQRHGHHFAHFGPKKHPRISTNPLEIRSSNDFCPQSAAFADGFFLCFNSSQSTCCMKKSQRMGWIPTRDSTQIVVAWSKGWFFGCCCCCLGVSY